MQSADTRDDRAAEETAASGVYDETFGAEAPELSREIGADLGRAWCRTAAWREAACQQLGLDDVTLELLKIAATRDAPGVLISDAMESWLAAVMTRS